MRLTSLFHCVGALGILLSVGLTGCTKEKKVFVERPFFDDPPTAAQGFLGFDNVDTKMTVCGNCHIGQQTKWAGTAHADAWKSLVDSGHSAAYCENCHSSGPNGNATDGAVGYAGVNDARYHDVQCESCHGPGLTHVQNPDVAANKPSASIKIFDANGDPKLNCAECHTGVHEPFAEEWAESKHAHIEPSVASRLVSDPAGSVSCKACHTGQGALAAWGVNNNFIENSTAADAQVGITCAVCHDPHSHTNDAQLRFPIDVPDANLNLCIKCHRRRAEPELTSSRGPHAPEGPLVLGEDVGWWPAGSRPDVDRIAATHGTIANPRLCATCHVSKFDVTDPATGGFQFHATGHLFQAIPCIGPDGKPTTEECDVSSRSFNACATSGCHGTPDAARAAYTTGKARIGALTAEVDRLNALVPSTEFSTTDGVLTVAEGAKFNSALCQLPGSSTHNPFITEQLLLASITALKSTYNLQSAEFIPMERQFK